MNSTMFKPTGSIDVCWSSQPSNLKNDSKTHLVGDQLRSNTVENPGDIFVLDGELDHLGEVLDVDPGQRLLPAAHPAPEAEEKLPEERSDQAAASAENDPGSNPDVSDAVAVGDGWNNSSNLESSSTGQRTSHPWWKQPKDGTT